MRLRVVVGSDGMAEWLGVAWRGNDDATGPWISWRVSAGYCGVNVDAQNNDDINKVEF